MAQERNIHVQHRKRLKHRFRTEGLDHFDERHVLELLLFYGIPQGDTSPLAHRLLARFGGLPQVLEAPAEDLEKIPGVGEHVSTLLSLVREIARYYIVSKGDMGRILSSTRACGEFLVPYFVGRREETVYALCLDSKCKVLCCAEVGSGSINAASISVRKVVEVALNSGATSVVLGHNHPSGLALPSEEDVLTTRRLAMALDGVGVLLADHIVVADNDYVSIAESGMFRPEEWRMPL